MRRPVTLRHRRLVRAAALALVALLLLGCGSTTPSPPPPSAGPPLSPSSPPSPSAPSSPTATPDPETVYRTIEDQVVQIRGLQPKSDVNPQVLDPGELRERIEQAFARDNPPEVVRANERLLKGLGMLAEDASLSKLLIDMQSSQVAGFYDPDAKELFVVSKTGALGPTERVTFAHEYTHALQDQHYDLKSFDLAEVGQGDRGLARLSLIEGDATAVMTVWAQQNLTPFELLQLSQDSADPDALRLLESMPPILRETLFFPYSSGLQWVLARQVTGGEKAVDDAFGDPPASSEQVMHPEKYESGEKPVAVSLPDALASRMGSGWKLSLQDTLGEFQIGVWLRGGMASAATANAAAAGWGGDRIGLLEGPQGAWAIAWLTAWDGPADASEFRTSAAEAIDRYGIPESTVGPLDGVRQTLTLASDEATLVKLDAALGLP